MLRWLIRRKLDSEEKRLGESMDYLRYVVDASPAAFLRFASIMPFANARKQLPKEAWFVAQIVGAKKEDCGPCVQITVNLAREFGVDAGLLRQAVDGDFDALPDDLADVARFAESVVAGSDDQKLRARLVACYGERGLIELAYAIASSRIPPTVKRALGYAKSCAQVDVRAE